MLGIQASFLILNAFCNNNLHILGVTLHSNMKSARLDTKWTYRWTQKKKSYTKKYIIIMYRIY